MTDELSGPWLEGQLLAITLATGLLDAVSYGEWGVFASNQTGNVILLLAHSIAKARDSLPPGLQAAPPLLLTGLSLAGFLASSFASGRLGHSWGHQKRWWFVLSGCLQTSLLLAVAILVQHKELVLLPDAPLAAIPVTLLAMTGGFQVSQARCSGVNEVPTAMLTSPMVDFLNRPDLFSLKGSHTRDLRALYILSFICGIAVGSIAHTFGGALTALFLGFGLRAVGTIVFMVQPLSMATLLSRTRSSIGEILPTCRRR